MNISPAEMEGFLGLTEITMIRLPTKYWASKQEQAELDAISSQEPEDWPLLLSRIARTSAGFCLWLDSLRGGWTIPEDVSVTYPQRLAEVDFTLPWCVRLRWGGRISTSVDVFLHGTGAATSCQRGAIDWQTITSDRQL